MKLPNIRRILREDLGADVPNWTLNLIGPLNSFMESVYQTLNKNVTFSENIASFVTEITVRTDGSGNFDRVQFLNQIKTRPQSVQICQVYVKSTFDPIAAAAISWNTDGTNLNVYEITGLSPSETYIVRLLIF